MLNLIDKTAAYNALKHEAETHELSFTVEAYDRAARIIDQMPTIEAEPVRHGRWLPCMMLKYKYECGCCEEPSNYPPPYCPNCGAEMNGKVNDENP